MFGVNVPSDVDEETKALLIPRFQYQDSKPVGLIDPVTGLPAAALAEYLWDTFVTLDPANFNGKFIRVIDKHSSLNLAGGVVFVGDSTVVPAKFQQVSAGGIVFANFSDFPASSAAVAGWRCWSSAMKQEFFCDGTRWRPLNNWMVLSKLSSLWTKSDPGSTEEFPIHALIPSNNGKSLMQPGDYLEIDSSLYKSGGTTRSMNRVFRFGTSLSASATILDAGGNMSGAAGGAVLGEIVKYERRANSGGNGRLLRLGAISSNGWGGYQTSATVSMQPVEVSVSNPDGSDVYFMLGVTATANASGSEAITMSSATIRLITVVA